MSCPIEGRANSLRVFDCNPAKICDSTSSSAARSPSAARAIVSG